MNVVSKIGVAVEIEQARENDFGLTSDWLKKKTLYALIGHSGIAMRTGLKPSPG